MTQPATELWWLLWRNSFTTVLLLALVMLVLLPHVLRPLTTPARALREMAEGDANSPLCL